MQHSFPSSDPITAAGSSGATPPAGNRSGQGAGSALPPLHEDAGRRPAPQREHAGTDAPATADRTPGSERAGAIGKYMVSPLVRSLDNGWFATSVSIRSGNGAATTDRVLRLTRLFQCAQQAASYARAEALQWISAPHRLLAA